MRLRSGEVSPIELAREKSFGAERYAKVLWGRLCLYLRLVGVGACRVWSEGDKLRRSEAALLSREKMAGETSGSSCLLRLHVALKRDLSILVIIQLRCSDDELSATS